MTFRDSPWPEGTPCWVEVRVADPVRTSTFYGKLFGWTFFDHGPEYDHYLTARLNDRAVADIGPRAPGQPAAGPSAWLVCFAVTSADATAARITEAGGTVPLAPCDVGDHGRFAVAADPAGAEFAVWQAYAYPGAEVTGVPGAAVWHHCASRDAGASLAFYAAVFGHTVTRAPGGCTTLGLDGRPVASVGEVPTGDGGAPSHWDVTFGVEHLATALTRITELGGTVREGPFDTPHGPGARVTDAQGTPFDVLETGGGH
ncbi:MULTISPECIES: VOC family protein [Streptomyces]|uniref:Vicinal oxygen chelate protein n=1 Tax=Streptomyces albus subsp. chlorinus TaxID=337066 RepID=A0A3G4YJJ5_9ACTN|nr:MULTISPECIES: VOC family protein [Streptomyces]UZN59888.1 vicinal oxygen chelate protein [Streptomyces albus subsp. chlorinus] [Streptomyces sp. GBA 94-10 4N24]WAE20001.1 vicinal oxygen chelate protein [Streptomyces albus subsp. chlorinus] [Streptomyces albidoflavus]AYV61409.1 vicinal oxygen chelate protein [Streptomyces albus subsp. chlorinus]NSC25057.1 VOC family protein [Streptomyces albus subsp. chlorinus]UZN60202.1 vicinal oxygen chelate protein [Streptomyces albus subsp. chlorinus] [S